MEKENIKTDEPRIETLEPKKLGVVLPEKVEEMKKLSKKERNEKACEELTPLNSDEVIAARQAQIDLKEEQEVREEPSKKPKKK